MQLLSQPEIADSLSATQVDVQGTRVFLSRNPPLQRDNLKIPTTRVDPIPNPPNSTPGSDLVPERMAAVYASIIARVCDRGLWFIVCSLRLSPHLAFIPPFLPCAF
jgi:hypothetical protein